MILLGEWALASLDNHTNAMQFRLNKELSSRKENEGAMGLGWLSRCRETCLCVVSTCLNLPQTFLWCLLISLFSLPPFKDVFSFSHSFGLSKQMFLKWHVYPQTEVMAILCTWIAANEKWLLELTYWQPGRISSPPCTVPSMACGGSWRMLFVLYSLYFFFLKKVGQ